MRRKPAIILSACLLASSSAFAADQYTSAAQSPLAPGKAAGLKKAEMTQPSTAVWVAGGAIVAAGLVLVLSNGDSHHAPATTTTSTSSTGTH